jgi:hypothetical protein
MVHVKKCPYGNRSRAETAFWIDGKPQIYCAGWYDRMTDEPLEICAKCADWAYGEQCDKDYEEARENENE